MTHQKMVGPVVRGMDAHLAEAVITAIEMDNPDLDVEVDDQGGYIRVEPAGRCRPSGRCWSTTCAPPTTATPRR